MLFRSHYFTGDTHNSPLVEDLTAEEVEAYNAGYDYNEEYGDKKDWG